MELQITVDDRKAKHFLAFLKELDFVVVKEKVRKVTAKKAKEPEFAYFGACPDWEMDADVLRATSNREKAQW